MRTFIFISAIIAMLYPVAASAVIGVGLGGKVGNTSYSGNVLPGSGDVGSGTSYGAMLEITTIPVFDLELHATYLSKPFEYTYDAAGVPVSTQFDFQDASIMAIVKKNLIAVPGSPLGIYVGVGVGVHVLSTEVIKGFQYDAASADDPVSLLQSNSKFSGHGMFGVRLAPPVIPLAIFGQARFGRIFTDESIRTTTIEGGLMLRF